MSALPASAQAALDATDRAIVDALQEGFPLCERPFAVAGAAIGVSEDAMIGRVTRLLGDGTLTRFGPLYDVERMGGAFTLAAMAVPAARWDDVVATVNARPDVAHNYARDHALNLWFVLATETPDGIAAAVAAIEADTGLPVFAFPKEREYFVDLRFRA